MAAIACAAAYAKQEEPPTTLAQRCQPLCHLLDRSDINLRRNLPNFRKKFRRVLAHTGLKRRLLRFRFSRPFRPVLQPDEPLFRAETGDFRAAGGEAKRHE